MKSSTCKRTKKRDLRYTLIQNDLQLNCFGTEEDKTIEKEDDVFFNSNLAKRTDSAALIREVTTIYGPAVTFSSLKQA